MIAVTKGKTMIANLITSLARDPVRYFPHLRGHLFASSIDREPKRVRLD